MRACKARSRPCKPGVHRRSFINLRRIDKDLRIFRQLGLTEEQVLRMQHLCRSERAPANATECHIRQGFHQRVAPRFLVSGGNVFLTHVVPNSERRACNTVLALASGTERVHACSLRHAGHMAGEVIGFMQEVYEVSRIYE